MAVKGLSEVTCPKTPSTFPALTLIHFNFQTCGTAFGQTEARSGAIKILAIFLRLLNRLDTVSFLVVVLAVSK